MVDTSIKNIRVQKLGYNDSDFVQATEDTVFNIIEVSIGTVNVLYDNILNSINSGNRFISIKLTYSTKWTIKKYQEYYNQLKKIANHLVENDLLKDIMIREISLFDIRYIMLNDIDDTITDFRCAHCPIAEGCRCSRESVEQKEKDFLCKIHRINSMIFTYVHNYNAKYKSDAGSDKMYASARLNILCPYDWAIEIISDDEYDELYKLSNMDKRII